MFISRFIVSQHRSRFSSNVRTLIIGSNGLFPYGVSNWSQIVEKQYPYVDRTEAIAKLATTFHSCLWSPRRTGKSLLCNQLALWHDKAITKEKREELFSGTYIGNNPSDEAGEYLVLHMDFSDVDDKDIVGTFTTSVNGSIAEFSKKYYQAGLLRRAVTINENSFTSSLSSLASTVRLSNQNVSLIVDEVDSFTNRLLLQVSREKGLNESGYQEFVKKGGSMLYHFGCAVKSSGVDKMFITGVMPVDWTGVTSSLNTVKDLTHIPSFENTFGFKSSDMVDLLTLFFPEMTIEDRDKHLESMKNTCLGYRRSPAQVETLYNPQGVWYYLKELQKNDGSQLVLHMDPNVIPSSGDEVAAFLVKHAAAMDTKYSPVHYY